MLASTFLTWVSYGLPYTIRLSRIRLHLVQLTGATRFRISSNLFGSVRFHGPSIFRTILRGGASNLPMVSGRGVVSVANGQDRTPSPTRVPSSVTTPWPSPAGNRGGGGPVLWRILEVYVFSSCLLCLVLVGFSSFVRSCVSLCKNKQGSSYCLTC